MKSKLTLSLLLVVTSFQPWRSGAQGPVAPARDLPPKKASPKKRKSTEPSHDEKYEKALGWASHKEAARRRRQEEAEKAPVVSRTEEILRGQKAFTYRDWVGDYRPKLPLATLFPASGERPLPDYEALDAEWKWLLPRFELLRAHVTENTGSPRGDLEEAALRERVAAIFRVSLLRLRLSGAEQVGAWLRTEGETWMRALTAIAFDEATPEALRFVSGERQEYARELLAKRRAAPTAFPDREVAFLLAEERRPWPVDRVFMTEARKSLKPAVQMVANGIANDLQKYPDRSLTELRKMRRGGDLPGLAELDRVYTPEDVKLRGREDDLFNELRLRCELGRFEREKGAPARSLEDLVKAGFLDKIPAHSETGKSWSITQL